jgi:hypothetical protein
MVVVVVDEQSVCLWTPYTFRGFRSGAIPSRGIPAFQRNLNSVRNSAGIFLSISQVPLPKLIPPEFRELPGFWQESVGDSKDLKLSTKVYIRFILFSLFFSRFSDHICITYHIWKCSVATAQLKSA